MELEDLQTRLHLGIDELDSPSVKLNDGLCSAFAHLTYICAGLLPDDIRREFESLLGRGRYSEPNTQNNGVLGRKAKDLTEEDAVDLEQEFRAFSARIDDLIIN